jgi:hypothetical protein
MALQSIQSITPAIWLMLKDVPGGPVAFLNGLWGQLIGTPLCGKTEAVALEGKTLLISVSTLPWQRTLEKMSDLLVRRINGICGCSCVEQVRFQVATVTRASHLPASRGRAADNLSIEAVSRQKDSGADISNSEIAEAIGLMVSRYL